MLKILGFVLVGIGIVLFIIALLKSWSISIELAKLQMQYLKDNWGLIVGVAVSFIGGITLLTFGE